MVEKNLQILLLVHFHSILQQVPFPIKVYPVNLKHCQSLVVEVFAEKDFLTSCGWKGLIILLNFA